MRICLVSQEYPPETGGGGIGTQTLLKAHSLSARGHEVHIVSASWDREARTSRDRDALIHRIPEPQLVIPGYEPSTYWLAYSTAVAEKIHELEKQIGFDIIQFPEYGGEGFVYQTDTFRHRTARYVVQLHGPLAMFAEHMGWPERTSALYAIGTFMEGTVIHYADRVLASSHNTATFCARRYDYPIDDIRVIHSGIDTECFRPQPQPPSTAEPRILFVGNLTGSKGISSLVQAVASLLDRYPGICLRAIGKGDQEYVRGLMQTAADAGAQDNVEIVGYVPYDQLPAQYAWCDLFAGPSTYEPGPGNVYLEAMACGKPVIACTTGGAPEVVLHEETGLLVPPCDVVALTSAISTLAADRCLRQHLGTNGRTWIESNFSIERYADKVEGLYQEMLAS